MHYVMSLTFPSTSLQLPEFMLETLHGLVDYATVYAEDDIRFYPQKRTGSQILKTHPITDVLVMGLSVVV